MLMLMQYLRAKLFLCVYGLLIPCLLVSTKTIKCRGFSNSTYQQHMSHRNTQHQHLYTIQQSQTSTTYAASTLSTPAYVNNTCCNCQKHLKQQHFQPRHLVQQQPDLCIHSISHYINSTRQHQIQHLHTQRENL